MREKFQEEIPATQLTEKSKNRARDEYHNVYTETAICDDIFLEMLEKSYILSLNKIEERPINTKFILISNDSDNFDWPREVTFIKFDSQKLTDLSLSSIKKYIGFASIDNIYLVINHIKRNESTTLQLQLSGLLVFYKSIQYFVRKFEYWDLTFKAYLKDLGKLFRSIIFTVDNGKVIVSSFNNEFFCIEKGQISNKTEVSELLFKIMEENYGMSGLFEKYNDDVGNTWDSVSNTLKNIIKRISNERYGSTLIFCYDREIESDKYIHPRAIEIKVPLGTILDTHKDLIKNRDQLLKKYKDIEDLIVSLSKTDGALIFNDKIELIRAGVIFKVDKSAHGSGGARHKSAEAFIKATNTCGFVISQDGRITITKGKFKSID